MSLIQLLDTLVKVCVGDGRRCERELEVILAERK